MRHIWMLSAAALLAACSGSKDKDPDKLVLTVSTDVSPSPAEALPYKINIDNNQMDFTYAYPAQAAAIPALKRWLDADLAKQEEDTKQGTLEERKSAKDGGWEPRIYAHSTEWKVVAEIPGWLSLSADRYEFTGGAHGNPWSETLLWDKTANIRRDPLSLFSSKSALSAAIRPSFCDQIDSQREKKRGEPVVRSADGLFSDCIDPVESTIILGSSDKQHFDRIGVLVGPYAAGPYAEGSYEATIPVDAKILALVKPEYRASFAAKR
ncbi:MAG: DUF4163 domain-containing protein [Candidatus Andeanibacterium colombiense]|uniref:DUF4163 domain-containing protein n=1 Tax=Candidatus Andeanibacterium colombiense TaxID=3121345 RepID=A0AAJ6BP35_9SPHN|nr:MAG: DUF4163 domain-containing protein [Sphingomonadaceae bacterium]